MNNLIIKYKSHIFLSVIYCSLIVVNCSLLAQPKLDVIYIDPGHGGKDPGTIGDKTGVQEKNIVLPIGIKLGKLIEEKYPEVKVIYSRTTDEYSQVKDRTIAANNQRAKLFISIHANHKKQEESEKQGFEVYLLNKERFPEAVEFTMKQNYQIAFSQFGRDTIDNFIFSSLAQSGYTRLSEYLASIIEVNMLDHSELISRGVYQAGNWVTLGASMPSVLVETGYLSDINDEKYLSSDKGQNDIAIALFSAFQNFKTLYESQ
ncbi:MAG: N-acetylmuramoyl-L-alanine amidase [Ignavibacteria bacterium]